MSDGIGLAHLAALAVDLRSACGWLLTSTLAGSGLIAGFLLADRWDVCDFAPGALGGPLHGVVSRLGLGFLRRPRTAEVDLQPPVHSH